MRIPAMGIDDTQPNKTQATARPRNQNLLPKFFAKLMEICEKNEEMPINF